MLLSSTIGSVAAANPAAGAAVQKQSVTGAVLASLTAGTETDPGASSLLGAVFGRAQEVQALLSSLQPHLGHNVNTTA